MAAVTPVELVAALAIAVGLAGIVVPVLPGLVLVWAAVVVWALDEWSPLGWAVLAGATVVIAASQVVKYLVPGRQLRAAGVPTRTLVSGAILAVVGFFVVPVVGLVLGFVLGVWLGERVRLGAAGPAWASTKHAVKAVLVSTAIELAAGLVVAVGWAAAALSTAVPA